MSSLLGPDLWATFLADRSIANRAPLVERYLRLVERVVEYDIAVPRHVDRADLISAGVFGLIKALDNFDPDRGNKFETYASRLIRGAVLDELRELAPASKWRRRQWRDIDAARADLTSRLSREPTSREVADELGITEEHLGHRLADRTASVLVNLHDDDAHDLPAAEDTPDDPDSWVVDLRAGLAAAIAALPPLEKAVAALYYFGLPADDPRDERRRLTGPQIAELFDRSPPWVAAIRNDALAQARAHLVRNGREPESTRRDGR